jgi:PAS domain S-box-containing protein
MEDKLYRRLIQDAPFGYAYHKIVLSGSSEPADYIFLEVNSAFEKLTGLKADDIINKNVTEVIPGIAENEFDWIGYYGDIALNGGEKEFEQYTEGLERWYKVQVFSPEKYYFSTIFIDITKEKEQSAEFENFFSVNLDLLCIADVNGNFIKTNEAWSEILGYSTDDLNHKKFLDFIHPDDIPSTLEAMSQLGSQERVLNFVNRYRCKDGSYRFIEWRSYPKGDLIYAAARDITERKRAEEALSESEEKYRLLTEFTSDVIWVLNINQSRFTYISPSVFYLRGFTVEEAMAESLHEALEKESVEVVTKAIARDVETFLKNPHEPKSYFNEIRQRCKDGRVIWVEVSTQFRFNKSGEIEIVGVSRNIETRKKLESDLILAKEQAESASRAKSEFLANMSHEIRTPLNGVIGFTDLVLKTPLDKLQRQYLENVNTSGYSLMGIINDILDFSKIEAGKMELDPVKADIIELTEQSTDIIKYQASQKGLEFLLHVQPGLPRFALVDPMRLRQILVNLLGNAVKFTESGEVELRISFAPKENGRGEFTFLVRDTGVGISEEQQGRLFKAFSQADNSTTRKFGGTGLGLAISNMLAGKMGSRIEIASEPCKGSNFFFTIETEFEEGAVLSSGRFSDINRVLVIDDNDNNRMILEKTFDNWGIEFTGVNNGRSAVEIIEASEPFDLAIVDYQMPGLNGIDTIRVIREKLKVSPDKLPVILLHSSSDDIKIYEECRNLGVMINLVKPVKSTELMHLLRNIKNSNDQFSEAGRVIPEPDKSFIIKLKTPPVILIAEDEPMSKLLIKTIVKQMIPDAEIVEVSNGREVVHAVLMKQPSLILMDVQMPEMDGIEAAVEIRSYEHDKKLHVPIIALTAGVVKEEQERCIQSGMDDFLPKPLSRKELYRMLEYYLSPERNAGKKSEKK